MLPLELIKYRPNVKKKNLHAIKAAANRASFTFIADRANGTFRLMRPVERKLYERENEWKVRGRKK